MEWVVLAILLSASGIGVVIGARLGRRWAPKEITPEGRRRKRRAIAIMVAYLVASFSVLAFAGMVPFLVLNGVVFGSLGIWDWVRALWRGRKAFRQ